MCEFCENIITNEEYDSLSIYDKIDIPKSFIMKDNILNQYHLFLECDDYYYSGKYLENIEYCPKCGRKLDE